MYARSSGLLCHITSLPGPHGIGDLGWGAKAFVGFLEASGQHIWQVLPLGPAGAGNSPYDSRSSFAGNPLMISVKGLCDLGLLEESEIRRGVPKNGDSVDFKQVEQWKVPLFRQAFARFQANPSGVLQGQYESFLETSAEWLGDYALYQALRSANGGTPWYEWDAPLRRQDRAAIEHARNELAEDVAYHAFVQFIFDLQWRELKAYATSRGVAIMGDVPIYVALDSADVWSSQEQFLLDEERQPAVQAGVPPDLFTEDGQLWGNPVYDWERMRHDGFRWWESRISRVLELTDIVRVDHFRGFAAGWQVPAGAETARVGEWVSGPGKEFFDAMESRLGRMPIVVEDLGVITPDVEELRDTLGYPGMKVLQFAFGDGADNQYLPHNAIPNSMMYTGTHDNDTARGWYASATTQEKSHARRYLAGSGTIHQDLLRAAWSSVSVLSCAPVQDLLGLGSESRMNIPGRPSGNWGWKLTGMDELHEQAPALRELTELYGRDHHPLGDLEDNSG